jgi:hypothetical protein
MKKQANFCDLCGEYVSSDDQAGAVFFANPKRDMERHPDAVPKVSQRIMDKSIGSDLCLCVCCIDGLKGTNAFSG